MTMIDERIKAAKALTGYTPGPWSKHKCQCGHHSCNQHTISTQGNVGFDGADADLIVAAPDLHRLVLDLAAERERLRKALQEQIAFHAMDLTFRRGIADEDEISDIEFRRDRARAALASEPRE